MSALQVSELYQSIGIVLVRLYEYGTVMYETTSTVEYPYNRTVLVRVLVSLGRAGRTRQDLPGQDVAQDESRKGRKG